MSKKKKKKKKKSDKPTGKANTPRIDAATDLLELIGEAKLQDLLVDTAYDRFEASGVQYRDGYFYIVLDNTSDIVRIEMESGIASTKADILKVNGVGSGYEDITYQADERRWYCMIEADESKSHQLKPRVDAFDEDFQSVESFWLDFPLKSDNKGIEGLSHLRYQGEDYILGLCEGNDCASGAKGRKPGNGRLQLFRHAPDQWTHAGTVKLPPSVLFEDYSSLDIRDRYVTVLSQVTSAVWVGRVRENPSSLDDLWEDDGHIAEFPRDEDGNIVYCNLEGITWLESRTFAVVSDKIKGGGKQPKRCKQKDQSIHIFRVRESQ